MEDSPIVKNETGYKKYTKSRRKYNASQIAKGVGLGISLTGFGAAMNGAFNNIDLSNVEEFAKQAGEKALDFYKELAAKCNPEANVPAYVFLGLAGGLIVWMVIGRIKKRRFETKKVSEMSHFNETLANDNSLLLAKNEELQKKLKPAKKPAAKPKETATTAE